MEALSSLPALSGLIQCYFQVFSLVLRSPGFQKVEHRAREGARGYHLSMCNLKKYFLWRYNFMYSKM